MKRVLTPRERDCIADALIAQARIMDERAEKILGPLDESSIQAVINEDSDDKKAAAAVRRFRQLTAHGNALSNLAHFISHNEVTVDCLIMIPEQI